MKTLTIIFIWIVTIPVFGQFEVFPTYKLIKKDSLTTFNGQQFIKTIKIVSDTIYIEIDYRKYAFVSKHSDSKSTFSYPVFVADFDSKYNMEISSWEIKKIDPEYVIFKLSYTRRHKKKGGQKGKYYITDNYKVDKNDLVGYYIGEIDNRHLRKVNIINLGLGVLVIGAIIIGTR